MTDGWLKIHRKLMKNPVVMKDSDHFAVWMYLLLNATHVHYTSIFNGKKVKLKPGELITGRSKISLALKVSESKVQRILKLFENEQMFKQQTTNKSRLISILKWNDYQISEQQFEQQVNNKRTTSEQQVNTIQEGEEYKNVKKKIPPREKIFEDKAFYESIRMRWRVTDEQLSRMLDDFEGTLIAEEKVHKDYPGYKSHFNNWGAKRFTDYTGGDLPEKTKMVH